MTKKPPKKKNYLNNADMLKEFELSKQQGRMTENFGRMIILLCEKVAKMPKFAYYTYRDDMVGNAIMVITRVWSSFDSTKSNNPFSYYTQVCINAFIQILNKEKGVRDLRDELRLKEGLDVSWSYQERSSDEDDMDVSEHYDNSHERDLSDFDNTVYDVTEEYTSMLEDAFGKSEPVEVVVEEVEEEEVYDNSQELIASYLATITPTPTQTPTPTLKQQRVPKVKVEKPKKIKVEKPKKIKVEKPKKIKVEKPCVIKPIRPDKHIVRRGDMYYFKISQKGYKLHSPFFMDKEILYDYRSDCLELIDRNLPQEDIKRIMADNPKYSPTNAATLSRMHKKFNDMRYITNKDGINKWRVIINNKVFKVDKQFKSLELAKEYRDSLLKGT